MSTIKGSLGDISEVFSIAQQSINTEEATKNALIMPFIQAIGYNIFNPMEVIPEFSADIGTKTGEKVDYAILEKGEPTILIECKHWKENLDKHTSQLYRYFGATKVRFGILTNGIEYRIFSDLTKPNVMDDEPFFKFNIETMDDGAIEKLELFHKDIFNSKALINKAKSIKTSTLVSDYLAKELNSPSDEFAKLVAKNSIKPSRITDAILVSTKNIIPKLIKELINNEIVSKFGGVALKSKEEEEEPEKIKEDDGITTTEEEMEAYHIVKAIASEFIEPVRVIMKDTKSYCGVLVDNNVRRPIIRFRFNTANKYISVFGEDKAETKHPINSVEEIYNYRGVIQESIKTYK